MPWHIIDSGGKHCVAKEGSSSPIPGGCHDTVEEARRHMAALYAGERKLKATAAAIGEGVAAEWLRPSESRH